MSVILVVDDEKNIRMGLSEAIRDDGFEVLEAENGKEAWSLINRNNVDLVLTDLRMPEMTGEELIKKIRSSFVNLPIIVLTGHGTIENAVEIMKYGGIDFYTKPIDTDKLLLVIRKSIRNTVLEEQNRALSKELEKLRKTQKYPSIIGSSDKIEKLMETVKMVAPTKTTVLIEGESGTGKELIADALHAYSNRSDKPFVKVNCASLSSSLLESELFGHEKGAFTGAVKETRGRFELASGGTIFLDEIGEIDESTQIKLLRVLENREITRVGGEKTIPVDVRVICATNKDLKKRVEEGLFREDFYFRLAVVTLSVPPLRERKEDIELLSLYYMKKFSEENGKKIDGLSLSARKALYSYQWPGNIRELRNAMESGVVLCKGRTIELEDLPSQLRDAGGEAESTLTLTLPVTLSDAEKKIIIETLSYCRGNKSRASEMLDIGRKTLHRKLSEWKMGDDDEK